MALCALFRALREGESSPPRRVQIAAQPSSGSDSATSLAARAVLEQIDETGAVQGVSGGTGMGYNLQHYKDIIVTPTAYGQGLTFLMLTELMQGVVTLEG